MAEGAQMCAAAGSQPRVSQQVNQVLDFRDRCRERFRALGFIK